MNKATKYLLFSFAYLVVGLVVGLQINANRSSKRYEYADIGISKLEKIIDFVEDKYVVETDRDALIENAIEGIFEELDPHSFYITPEEMGHLQEQLHGRFEGIGITFEVYNDTVYIVALSEGGPSDLAGVKVGDRIIQIDEHLLQREEINPHVVEEYLKGPADSSVLITVVRSQPLKKLNFTIKRANIELPSVEYAYSIRPGTGYIKIARFAETTYEEFMYALEELKEQQMENLILDLRNNPGGYMNVAYKIADEFLSSGKLIVSTEGRIRQSRHKYEAVASKGAFEQGPLIILIDFGTASASEIVAGAVQDHDRGVIAGLRSFGKGLVQIEDKYEDGSAIRLVISEYYTPSGRCIQKPYQTGKDEYALEIERRFESGEIVDASKIHVPDSLVYKTRSGRVVYGGGGIVPDVFIPNDTAEESLFISNLWDNGLFRLFSFHYTAQHPDIRLAYKQPIEFVEQFKVTNGVEREFIQFIQQKDVLFDPENWEKERPRIYTYIKAYLGDYLFKDQAYIPLIHKMDSTLQKALELIPAAKELERSGKLLLANR